MFLHMLICNIYLKDIGPAMMDEATRKNGDIEREV